MRKLSPYLFTFLVVAALALYLIFSSVGSPFRADFTPEPEEIAEEDSMRVFTGRVVMPDVDNILVLDNSAGRDVEKLALFFSGRATGLHWLVRPYFKKHRTKEDVIVGVNLTIDSLGHVTCGTIEYTNAEDDVFTESLRSHIEYFWRYRRSEVGKTELWLPIKFLAHYNRR